MILYFLSSHHAQMRCRMKKWLYSVLAVIGLVGTSCSNHAVRYVNREQFQMEWDTASSPGKVRMFASLWNREKFRTSGITIMIEDDQPPPNSLRVALSVSISKQTRCSLFLVGGPTQWIDKNGKQIVVDPIYGSFVSYRRDLLCMCRALGVDTLAVKDYLDGYDDTQDIPDRELFER